MVPLDVLLQYLNTLDEVMICEILDISTEDLLKAFESKIEVRRQYLEKELELYGEAGGIDTSSDSTLRELHTPDTWVDEDYDPDEWN